MSDLEMVLVLVSMVLASGMVRALEGAVALLASKRRSWMAAAFLYHSFVYPVAYLLALLSYRDTEFFIAQHFLALLVSSCLFVRAHIAATSHPHEVADWAEQAAETARPFFATTAAINLLNGSFYLSFANSTLLDPPMFTFYLGIAMNVLGCASRNPRIHAAVAIAGFAMITFAGLNLALRGEFYAG